MATTDGDENGDYTPFWVERDYNKDAGNVPASVFVVHGLQDDNVMPDHFSKWWDALPSNVAKKLWLTRTGHIDPFDFRRAEWVRRCTGGSTTSSRASRTTCSRSPRPTSSTRPTTG